MCDFSPDVGKGSVVSAQTFLRARNARTYRRVESAIFDFRERPRAIEPSTGLQVISSDFNFNLTPRPRRQAAFAGSPLLYFEDRPTET